MVKSEVSSSMWLFGEEAVNFNVPIEIQRMFIGERERRVEEVIRELQLTPALEATEDQQQRMRDCIDTRKWVDKMWKELGGRPK